MRDKLFEVLRNERATTAIEFALIGAIVAVAIVVGASALGASLADAFHKTTVSVTDAAQVWLSD
jgi:Flp pilus assembly pilin Flp